LQLATMEQLELLALEPRRVRQVLAYSGGKDSTALAYRMAELGEDFAMLFTAMGNELPGVTEHVRATASTLGRELILPPGPSLESLMVELNALPNNRQRWCTRMIKIIPCIAYLKANPGTTLCVGLRTDEEERVGLYGEHATYRFPLREWGWGLKEVWGYLDSKGVCVPPRTDCAWCYDQRLIDWKRLLQRHPDVYAAGEAWESKTGHTFRSPTRDTWPAPLAELRVAFESGRPIRGEDNANAREACRVCRG